MIFTTEDQRNAEKIGIGAWEDENVRLTAIDGHLGYVTPDTSPGIRGLHNKPISIPTPGIGRQTSVFIVLISVQMTFIGTMTASFRNPS